jgi:aldehyde:ferredoxin oxidoreductase
MLKEPLPDGVAKGQTINLEPMITEYYELRGWDGQTGLPTAEKLKELSLPEVADDLAARGLLAES